MKNQCRVVLSPNIKKTSERINIKGDVIDPRTKQVIVPNEVEAPPPPTPPAPPPQPVEPPVTPEVVKDDGLGVLDEIQATKKRLAELEELKRLKIKEKEAELELLKN